MTNLNQLHCLLEFAYSRAAYKDHLEHKLIGAIVEYYKAEHAKANGKKRWVVHWTNESKRLLLEFGALLLHTIKGCRNRRKAAEEVLQIIKDGDHRYRRAARNTVCRDFNEQLDKPIPMMATTRFYRMVEAEIEDKLDETQ